MTMAVELEVEVDFAAEEMRELYGDIKVSIARITPEVAAEWLKCNTKNRPLNDKHVQHMAEVMTAGDMVFNGETIIFDTTQTLLNGQHQLTAGVESGVTFDKLVVRNVSPDVFDTLDGGRKRKASEMLAMNGEQNSTNVAAAVSALVAFVDHGGNITGNTGGARVATPQVCKRVLHAHPGLRDSVRKIRQQRLYDNQWAYLLHYLFSSVDPQLADDFVEVLCVGSPDVGRPFNVFREHLIKTPGSPGERRPRAAKAIKAFNAERSGNRPKMFSFTQKKEDFPAIDGLDYEKLAESIA